MTTLESHVNGRLTRMREELDAARACVRAAGARGGDDAEAARHRLAAAERAVEEGMAEYLLNITPYVREYYEATHKVDPAEGPRGGLEAFVHITHMSNKNNVLQRFLVEVENDECGAATTGATAPPPKKPGFNNDDYVCPSCRGNMVVNHREACHVCVLCGTCKDSLDFELTYEQQQDQFANTSSCYAYKRLNHLCETLATLQGKSNTEIPKNVIDAVAAEFKKSMATRRADVTPQRVLEYLKKLKQNKYYEHKYGICERLGGMPAPKLDPRLESTLKRMFEEVQAPFDKHCPACAASGPPHPRRQLPGRTERGGDGGGESDGTIAFFFFCNKQQ